jgi:uncharacterized protein YdhG (YjbR/CyaY superfamily)
MSDTGRKAAPAKPARSGGAGRGAEGTGAARRTGTTEEEGAAGGGNGAVEAYLAALPAEQREALQRLRETIRSVAPGATEVISYGIPTFKLGRSLVGFNASAAGCTLQLMSTAVLEAHAAELAGYGTGKGSVRFTPDKPLPEALVRKLVEARLAENERLGK